MDELNADGIEVQLDTDQARLLAESKLVDVQPLSGHSFRLLPNGRVGAVRFEDLQIEVTPKHKLGVAHLMFLLGYAKNPGFRPDSVMAETYSDLWPAMAHSLVVSVERSLTLGLLQGYRTEQEALLTVRGRIAFEEQIRRRPGYLVPIEVRYDEFSPDIAENQILLAALHLMLGVPRLQPETRRRLLHLAARFAGVTRLLPGTPIPRWHRSRLNERYQSALGLAEVLLRNSSARASAVGVEMSAFVVVMWKVFEDFVTTALRDVLADHPGFVRPQLPAYLTGEGDWSQGMTGKGADDPHGDVVMDVDVVHLDDGGTPNVVFDAKYKLASSTGDYANADHYQMLAYCTALQVPVAWLIYAGGGQDIRRTIKNTGVDVVAAPINLRQSPEEVLARIRQIALRALDEVPALA
ncbi:restriction endonuclease [Nocardioides sp. HDW12B]|uniref:McrC family protein n=1 Tax=Nocardioides sp. HDW12B TaxID=2714939 RepID=UPI00140B111E|nr:restriction endonuclease [Nocardioides sp. HDW12B]QIK67287.1 restriction endonuclease [Nocardioides sp. HDW12B]